MKDKAQFFDANSRNTYKASHSIILYNDSLNTFDHVMTTLSDLLEMDLVQAEQIATLVHYKGSCDIKSGPFEVMEVYKEILEEKGLTVSIEEKINV